MLAAAERPFVMLGGGGWNAQACADIREFIETNNLPTACAYRCQDLLDNRSPNYLGDIAVGMNPAIEKRIRECDLLLAVGLRLGEWTTINYTLVDIPRPKMKFIHVHPGAEELGRVYQADLLINAGMPEFAAAAKALPPVPGRWARTACCTIATLAARSDPAPLRAAAWPYFNGVWPLPRTSGGVRPGPRGPVRQGPVRQDPIRVDGTFA